MFNVSLIMCLCDPLCLCSSVLIMFRSSYTHCFSDYAYIWSSCYCFTVLISSMSSHYHRLIMLRYAQVNIPVPLFGSPLYTYKVTLLVYSHHFHEVSYVLMSLLDIAMTLERLCICKGVYCLVCWNTCMCLHMDTHNSIHVLPHSPSSCILL